MPVGVFRFLASNEGDAPADVAALAFSFENILATTDVAPGRSPERRVEARAGCAGTHATLERARAWPRGRMHTDDVVYGTRAPSEPWHGVEACGGHRWGGGQRGRRGGPNARCPP